MCPGNPMTEPASRSADSRQATQDSAGNAAPLAAPATGPSLQALRDRLLALGAQGSPRLRALAAWLADRPEELAFQSVRGLADLAGANPNTVVRLARSLGFTSYDEARSGMQQALRNRQVGYAARAAALSDVTTDRLVVDLHASARANADALFDPALRDEVLACVQPLLSARQVHCIGVRMGFSLAHYFTYRGRMAHANIQPVPGQPGLILDAMSDIGPQDIVVAISFAHYSAEVLRAAEAAREQGARVLAVTDSYGSPLAVGAWRVLCPPMQGPNLMFPMSGVMLLLELLLEAMAAAEPAAQTRVATFESRLLAVGAYRARGSGTD